MSVASSALPPHAVITGDVGGTSARMQVWMLRRCVACHTQPTPAHAARADESKDDPAACVLCTHPYFSRVYSSKSFRSLSLLIQRVLLDASGPVKDNTHAHATGCECCGSGCRSTVDGTAAFVAGNTCPALASCAGEHVVCVSSACVAVCGPVLDGHVYAENLEWDEHTHAVQATTAIPHVDVLNDFMALGLGLTELALPPAAGDSADAKPASTTALVTAGVVTLHAARRLHGKPMTAIGAGTGLGAVHLTFEFDNKGSRGQYVPWPSEGGMARFTAQSQLEWDLSCFIAQKSGDDHVETEHVVSGQVRCDKRAVCM